MDKTIPPNDEEITKMKDAAATRIINFFRNLKPKFRLFVLLSMISKTQDAVLIQEAIGLAILLRNEQLALETLQRIYAIIINITQNKPTAVHQIISRIFYSTTKKNISSLQQFVIYFHSSAPVYSVLSELIHFLLKNPNKETMSLLFDDESNGLLPTSLLLSLSKNENFQNENYKIRVIQIQIGLCQYQSQYKKKFFSNHTTCEVMNLLLRQCLPPALPPDSGTTLVNSNAGDSSASRLLYEYLHFLNLLCHENPVIYHLMGEKGLCQSLVDLLLVYHHQPAHFLVISEILLSLTYTHQPNQLILGTATNITSMVALVMPTSNPSQHPPLTSTSQLMKPICHLIANLCPNDTVLNQLPIPVLSTFLLSNFTLFTKPNNLEGKILKCLLLLLSSLVRNTELKQRLQNQEIVKILEKIQQFLTSTSLTKLLIYVSKQFLDDEMRLTGTSGASSSKTSFPAPMPTRYSQKILRPSFSDSEFSQYSNPPAGSHELLQQKDQDDDFEVEDHDDGSNTSPPVLQLSTHQLTHEIAMKRIQNLVMEHFKKKKYQTLLQIQKLKIPTLLVMIETTNDTSMLMEGIQISYFLSEQILALKTLTRCNWIIKEAKKTKKSSTLVSKILNQPKHFFQLIFLFKSVYEVTSVVLSLLIRLTYATNGNEILGKNGIFQWLTEVMILFSKQEDFVSNCFILILRLLKSSTNITQTNTTANTATMVGNNNLLRVFQKKYLETMVRLLTGSLSPTGANAGGLSPSSGKGDSGGTRLERNPEIVIKYCQFLRLGLDARDTLTSSSPPSSFEDLLLETGHSEELLKLFLKYFNSSPEISEQLTTLISRLCSSSGNSSSSSSIKNISYFLSQEKILKYYRVLTATALDECVKGVSEEGATGIYQTLTNFLSMKLLLGSSSGGGDGPSRSNLCVEKYLESLPKTVPFLERILEKLLLVEQESQGLLQGGGEKVLHVSLAFLQNLFKCSSLIKDRYRDESKILSLLQQFHCSSSLKPFLDETIYKLSH
jgi:hypothetical protein